MEEISKERNENFGGKKGRVMLGREREVKSIGEERKVTEEKIRDRERRKGVFCLGIVRKRSGKYRDH